MKPRTRSLAVSKAALPVRTRLAESVREALRAEIQAGRWEKSLPSERHLSQEFQVGRPSLHLALCSLASDGLVRGRPGQPWEVVRGKVRPQRVPKRRAEVVLLRNARVKPDLTSLFPLMDALRQKLHRIGFDLVIADAMMQGAKRLDTTLSEIEAEHRPSFYLLYSVPTDVHRWFQKTNVPTLILGSRMPDVRLPAVDLDPVATVAHAVDHLFRRGHRRIGLLLTSASGVGDLRIEQQFYTDCKRHAADGMRGVMETAHARPAAVKAAIRRFFGRAQPPTAIIAADLELVIGTYAVLSEMGLAIPRQVSVLSAGYWPILDYLSPLPSCYKASWDRLSNHTIRVIGNYLRLGVWPNTFYKLLPTLREGQSVRTLS